MHTSVEDLLCCQLFRSDKENSMSHCTKIAILATVTVFAAIAVARMPRVLQPLDYHNFADQRAWFGVPNFLNVVSSLPFLAVGVWGLILVLWEPSGCIFITRAERRPYAILALGVALTCVGSSYHHLAPDNAWLVWDRLTMTLGFMSLLAAVIMERIHRRAGLMALGPLLLLGIGSVALWYRSELNGAGDLRLYLMVQFYALVLILLIVGLFPARYTRGGDLLVTIGFYALAKILESLDQQIFSLGHNVNGHTLKHLAAALGVFWIFRMLALRQPVVAIAPRATESNCPV